RVVRSVRLAASNVAAGQTAAQGLCPSARLARDFVRLHLQVELTGVRTVARRDGLPDFPGQVTPPPARAPAAARRAPAPQHSCCADACERRARKSTARR